jgi:hypothetical protein
MLRVFEIQNKYLVISVTDQESFVFVEFDILDEAQVLVCTFLSLVCDLILCIVGWIFKLLQLVDKVLNLVFVDLAYLDGLRFN